jgi:TatD DNase family protein
MIAAQVAEGAINGGPEDLWTELRRLLESDPNAQVGEAGLDRRYAGYEPGGVQEKVFRKQAEMALELGRDLQIHCVGDYGRIIRVLREVGFAAGLKCARPDSSIKRPRPVFHRFGGDTGIVKAGLSLGALFSVHADALRKKATREALALIPREHLLFETDADESFVETFIATRGSGDAITPQDVAVMLEDTLRDVVARFSPTP